MTHLTGSVNDDVSTPEFHVTLSALAGASGEQQNLFLADGRQIDVTALLQGGFTTTLIASDNNQSVGGFGGDAFSGQNAVFPNLQVTSQSAEEATSLPQQNNNSERSTTITVPLTVASQLLSKNWNQN